MGDRCLEGGAEEFLLKPLRLSDLDKIEAYLLKSLHHSCTIIDKDHLINDGDDDDDNNNDANNDDVDNSNDDNNINESSSSNNNNNNNNFSKRKAISSEARESERRPKMKGVALVV
ncbi:two-component response regulator ARR9-like protein [Corchorus capsularis]|uniref:Two-component response regulator ARR9-like protein n=1 Tax=Corchorus capsularis TaxID=210143 RepID=A0A1R3GSQ6_COCAP|nr:two-component response regulator ARR9-like protein [Corchorus capsularis]